MLVGIGAPFAFVHAVSPVVKPLAAPYSSLQHRPHTARITSLRALEEIEYAVDVPYKEAAYDPEAADAFFRARPMVALRRALQLMQLSGGFIFATLLDKKLGREEEMVEQRSQELLELVSSMGPTL